MTEHEHLFDLALRRHAALRARAGLTAEVPRGGRHVCPECGNHCRLSEGETGFCGLRTVRDNQVVERYDGRAIVSWYFDPLPTNCVADWVCGIDTHCQRLQAHSHLCNLAVFYGSCNSDCLFCQNASYKEMMCRGEPLMSAEELAAVVDNRTACVCYFGGDPSCNAYHSIVTSETILAQHDVKICYETNGNISRKWRDKISQVVLNSGGTLKFDLKAVTPRLYSAMTGVSNSVVLKNFKELARVGRDLDRPFLVASVLLVPGYVGVNEVRKICKFIAECDPTIPLALLAFAPKHHMSDLPKTSRDHALQALIVAEECGLSDVRIGNSWLLSESYYDIQ